jgi:hypothetical protein
MSNTVTVTSGLSAHFKQSKGPSRPGVDWVVQITGEQAATVKVRTYYSTDPPRETEKAAMAERAGRFITKKLSTGWFPLTETFLDADEDVEALGTAPKPWWKIF